MSEPSWIGRKLSDRYEIEDLLGAGGMSSVFRANDPNLRRAVAIKLIHPHLSSDPQFVSRFE
ncbi:MAG: serine/threonine protein kinase, partial [Anaerolineales bacterium]|nr:serine/threonine protein kinase [Anaerolineales bacterium]